MKNKTEFVYNDEGNLRAIKGICSKDSFKEQIEEIRIFWRRNE